LAGLSALPVTVEAEHLAAELFRTGCLPAAARTDGGHLAVAMRADVDFLLPLNCRHRATGQILRRLEWEAEHP